MKMPHLAEKPTADADAPRSLAGKWRSIRSDRPSGDLQVESTIWDRQRRHETKPHRAGAGGRELSL